MDDKLVITKTTSLSEYSTFYDAWRLDYLESARTSDLDEYLDSIENPAEFWDRAERELEEEKRRKQNGIN